MDKYHCLARYLQVRDFLKHSAYLLLVNVVISCVVNQLRSLNNFIPSTSAGDVVIRERPRRASILFALGNIWIIGLGTLQTP